MDPVDKILWILNDSLKNVRSHSKDDRNNEVALAYYEGFEAALKDIKKKTLKIKEEM